MKQIISLIFILASFTANAATYEEIAQLFAEGVHKNKIAVAVSAAALDILNEADTVPNHTERFAWAASAMSNPGGQASRFLIGVLTANRAATVTQIQNASDTAIQNNVNALIDVFALADSSTGSTTP